MGDIPAERAEEMDRCVRILETEFNQMSASYEHSKRLGRRKQARKAAIRMAELDAELKMARGERARLRQLFRRIS